MSYLQLKYKITPEQESKMVRDGVLDWTINYKYEIYKDYLNTVLNLNKIENNKMAAIQEMCDKYKISQREVYRIIKDFK